MNIVEATCPICKKEVLPLIEVRLLRKYSKALYRCPGCDCAFYPKPEWLDEAYSKAISDLDTGILERAVDISNVLTPFMFFSRFRKEPILDFGGGIGVLARMMRDRGFRASSHDPMAEKAFSTPDDGNIKYSVITMIEVLEHLPDPMTSLQELSSQSSLIFISTLATPSRGIEADWWYLLPDTGQHIFFPSAKTFWKISEQIGWHYVGNGKNLHVLSQQPINLIQKFLVKTQIFAWLCGYVMYPILRSRGLGKSDMEEIARTVFKD